MVAQLRTLTARALELDPNMGEAYASLGVLNLFYEWDLGEHDAGSSVQWIELHGLPACLDRILKRLYSAGPAELNAPGEAVATGRRRGGRTVSRTADFSSVSISPRHRLSHPTTSSPIIVERLLRVSRTAYRRCEFSFRVITNR